MNTSLPSMMLFPLMLILPSCGKLATLKPVPSNPALPAEATLTRLMRPPGANRKPPVVAPGAAPTFTGPPTNDSVLPTGTWNTLVEPWRGLNTPA